MILYQRTYTSQELDDLFKDTLNIKDLERLDVEQCIISGQDGLSLAEGAFENLKILNLVKNYFAAKPLESLLKAAPKIESLDLSESHGFAEGQLSLTEKSLVSLKRLKLMNSSITYKQLDDLLKAAPNVEWLDLSSCAGPFIEEEYLVAKWIEMVNFLNLEKVNFLKLANSPINPAQLKNLLEAAPNVATLDLSSCINFEEEDLSLETKSLVGLKTLRLMESRITAPQLANLLQAAPNVEYLCLLHCSKITDLSLTEKSLRSLKTLRLNSAKHLSNLLQAAPNLVSLQFQQRNRADDVVVLSLAEESLKDLKDVCLSSSSITAPQLANLLKAAPNVESLDLSGCRYLGEDALSLVKDGLSGLKTLKLNRSRITAPQLANLLKAAPNVESLDLSECRYLGEDALSLVKDGLRSLKTLKLDESSITAPQLENLLRAAPNVEPLDLSGCKNLGEDALSLVKDGLRGPKTLELDESSITVQPRDNNLLKAVPNLEHYSHLNSSKQLELGQPTNQNENREKKVLIEQILEDFNNKIKMIGNNHTPAKQVATQLHKNLKEMMENAFENPTPDFLQQFSIDAGKAIQEAIPKLKKDLGWGDYLINMLKKIVNAVVYVVTMGQNHRHSGFFALKESHAAKEAQDMHSGLDSALIPKP